MDYDSMPAGKEIDTLISRSVFNIELTRCVNGVYQDRLPVPELGCHFDGEFYICSFGRRAAWRNTPNYSTSIEDAFKIVEHIIGNCESDLFIESWSDGEWLVASHPVGYSSRAPVANCDGKTTGKPSLPLAICRWALKRQEEIGSPKAD